MGNCVFGRFNELLKSVSDIFFMLNARPRVLRGRGRRLKFYRLPLEREHVKAFAFGLFFGNALLGLFLDLLGSFLCAFHLGFLFYLGQPRGALGGAQLLF